MKENQKDIYYITGESKDIVIDEYAVSFIHSFFSNSSIYNVQQQQLHKD